MYSFIELEVQKFLNTLDVRQIVKIGFASSNDQNNIVCSIIYIDLEDVRDMRIDTIVNT